jgi:hypothetical protein
MRKIFCGTLLALVLIIGIVGMALAADTCKMTLKPGDTVYACNCGPECQCDTMANKPGNCACGKPMVQAKVTKVEGDVAYLEAPGWKEPRPFKMTGKYACNCGPNCTCGTISQKPGKCVCGKEMKKVE